MVARPDYASKKRISKTFFYRDGTQRAAHIGMVDDGGAFCYMLDTARTEHFKFHDSAAIIGELEAVESTLRSQVDMLQTMLDDSDNYITRLMSEADKSHTLLADLLDTQKYTPDVRARIRRRIMRLEEVLGKAVDDE